MDKRVTVLEGNGYNSPSIVMDKSVSQNDIDDFIILCLKVNNHSCCHTGFKTISFEIVIVVHSVSHFLLDKSLRYFCRAFLSGNC